MNFFWLDTISVKSTTTQHSVLRSREMRVKLLFFTSMPCRCWNGRVEPRGTAQQSAEGLVTVRNFLLLQLALCSLCSSRATTGKDKCLAN
jgi:hypothetical protein